jgi:uncharacterized protein
MSLKVILDTNVLYSALAFKGVCGQVLNKLARKNFTDLILFASTDTLDELKHKLNSQKFATYGITQTDIDDFVAFYEQAVLVITINQKVSLSRDPKDNMFLELAQAVAANYIVTGDKDLLDLKKIKDTKIIKPSEFLEILN